MSNSPEALLKEAAKVRPVPRVSVVPYFDAISELRKKGFSYDQIAAWLAKRTGQPVRRHQVYHFFRKEKKRREWKGAL